MLKIVALCIVALAITVEASPTSRIVGGQEAEVGEFPYQISLQYGYSLLHWHVCGGSVLNARWIMAAAHCITSTPFLPLANFWVKAGIHSLQDQGQEIKVKRFIIHPHFLGGTMEIIFRRGISPNDIALFELTAPLLFGSGVQAVTLPAKDEIPTGNSTLSGWGSTSTTIIPQMPDKLQSVVLPLLSHQECSDALIAFYGTDLPLAETNVCTGPLEGGQGPCSGDSGGPLVIRNEFNTTQIGITSWGNIPCGSKGAPSVFTRVSAFIDFINEHV